MNLRAQPKKLILQEIDKPLLTKICYTLSDVETFLNMESILLIYIIQERTSSNSNLQYETQTDTSHYYNYLIIYQLN